MTRGRKWTIRVLTLLEVAIIVSVVWRGLREVMFPNGTTPAEAVIAFFIIVVWEDVLKTKWRVEEVLGKV